MVDDNMIKVLIATCLKLAGRWRQASVEILNLLFVSISDLLPLELECRSHELVLKRERFRFNVDGFYSLESVELVLLRERHNVSLNRLFQQRVPANLLERGLGKSLVVRRSPDAHVVFIRNNDCDKRTLKGIAINKALRN